MSVYPLEPSIESFGAQLLATGDLDPLYIALHKANFSRDRLERWLFAYWCCYHAGASSYIADAHGMDYWERLAAMASNAVPSPLGARWPRGHERRHFRGDKAETAVDYYRHRWNAPEEIVRGIAVHAPSFAKVRQKAMELPQFGPWIAFKVADMIERLLGVHIDFTDGDVMMFDSPREAAILVGKTWSEHLGPPRSLDVRAVSQTLIWHFQHRLAPPSYDRPVNIQEVETILCKWKSHLNGHYPVGLDSREIKQGLHEWSTVSLSAERLHDVTP